MKKSTLKNLSLLTALAAMACLTGKANAITPDNWTFVGPSSGGGYVIVGSGTQNMGQLSSISMPVHLSAGGSDIVTLNAGSSAISVSFVIQFSAPNNVLNNFGTIQGASNEGLEVYSNGNTLNNWGTITSPDYSVDIEANGNVFNNYGLVSVTSDYDLYLTGTGNVINNWNTLVSPYDPFWEEAGSHNTLNNWGNILSTGTGGQYGVYSQGSFFTLNNWGAITVQGAGNQAVYLGGGNSLLNNYNQINSAGDGVDVPSDNNTINNYINASINSGSLGVYLDGTGNTINNNGAIIGASVGVDVEDGGNIINNRGLISGAQDAGVFLDDTHDVVNNWGTINSANSNGMEIDDAFNIVNNWGSIAGAGGGGDGIDVNDQHNVVNNWGTISSANQTGVYIDDSNNVINNWGSITGGQYHPLFIDDSNNVINNWGTFAIPSNGKQAIAINHGNDNNVINNWGMITSNGGPAGMLIGGNNNTLNLNGHSSVIGKITVAGATNVVNLNFTGVDHNTLIALNNSLLAQGANTGTPTSVQFTLRQVNYNIDPAMVNLNMSSYQMQGLNLTEREVGAGLDSLLFNPAPGTPLFNLLNAIDNSGNVPAALQALSPGSYAIYGDLAIANSTAIVQNVDARLNNLRDGSESIDTTGVGGTTDQTTAGFSKNDGKESKQIVAPPVERRWGFFATGDGLFYRGAGAAGGGKSNNAGTLLGVDGKINENGVIGTFFSYDNADAKFGGNGASHATIESYTGGIYGAYHNDGFFANGLAAYTRNNYASARSLAFPGFINSLGGSTDGNQYTFNLDGGYDWHLNDRVTMGPIAGLQYVHLDVDGFNETGGAGALAIGSQSMDSLQSRIGGRIDYHLHTGATSSVALDLHAAWQHEYLDDSRSISGGFGGAAALPISVQTGSPKRDAGVVGLGVNFSFHERLTLFADYELTMWSSSTFEQTINGGARISF